MIHIGSRSPCTPFSSSLHDTTFSRQSTPHFFGTVSAACQKPSKKPLGNLRKLSQLQRKPGGNPPLIALTVPLRPYNTFTLHRAFRFWAKTSRRLHSIGRGNTQPLGTLSGQDSLTRALKMSCHLDLNFCWLGINPHDSLQVDTCGMQTHAGRPHRLSRPTP